MNEERTEAVLKPPRLTRRMFAAMLAMFAEMARPAFRIGRWAPKLRKPNRSAAARAARRIRKHKRDMVYESRRRNRA